MAAADTATMGTCNFYFARHKRPQPRSISSQPCRHGGQGRVQPVRTCVLLLSSLFHDEAVGGEGHTRDGSAQAAQAAHLQGTAAININVAMLEDGIEMFMPLEAICMKHYY